MPSLEDKHGYTYVGSFHEGLATAFLKGDGGTTSIKKEGLHTPSAIRTLDTSPKV